MIERAKINDVELVSFGNESKTERKLLKQFVNFHWEFYKDEPKYIPLLDYEYLGFKLIGMTGFFEPRNLFFKHAEMRFFMVLKNGEVIGRCNAFANYRHNERWKDKVGFFGQFECIEDEQIAKILTEAAIGFLKDLGMKVEGKLTKFEAKMLIKEGLKKREKEKNDKMTKKTEDKSDIEILEETTDKLAKACSDKVNIPQQKTKPNNADSKSPSDTMDEFIKEEEEKTEEETYL